MINKTESLIDSCKSIIHFLVKEDNREVRELKYKDFKHKFAAIEDLKNYTVETKKKFDVIIFTVVKAELDTIDRILGLKTSWKESKLNLNNFKAWEGEVKRNGNYNPLTVLVVFIGEAGDIGCSIACMRVFQECWCDLAILCGIAAGYDKEIKKYSVVISDGVIDYEPQRIEKNGKITYRPNNFDPEIRIVRDAHYLETEDKSWRTLFLAEISKRKEIIKSELPLSVLKKTELKSGIIASGKKLLADNLTLPKLRKEIPVKKGIIAAEMEGSGFCPACNEFKVDWLIIRGISDYGGKDKNSTVNKKYQFVAATAAITAMIYYLQNIFRRSNEPGGEVEAF